MKNGLNRRAVVRLARNLERAHPPFDRAGFVRRSTSGLEALELKQRVLHVTEALRSTLPADYLQALAILTRTPENWDAGDENDSLRGFAAWPMFSFIELHGLLHFDESMEALRTLTPLFTAEFAVRPYLAKDPARAFSMFSKWALDPNESVRRLASEGSRPRLPWATRVPCLVDDPRPGLALLELLKDDPSETVRRSVGNHLNDLGKTEPELVLDLCGRWLRGASPERRALVEHATRSLVKEAHPRVWPLLGFPSNPKIACSKLIVSPRRLRLGSTLRISFDLENTIEKPQKLAIDYALHLVKANGETRPKVFKLKVLTLAPRSRVAVVKRHPIRAITTRRYYPGQQRIELFINGRSFGEIGFHLEV